jgi:hypothetical protein
MAASRRLALLVAIPFVLRAACRVLWLARRHGVAELAARLRAAPRFHLAPLARPELWRAAVGRLAPLLAARGRGACYAQSLLLLDLWARCGLAPRLHLSYHGDEGGVVGHAWVSAASGDGLVSTPSFGHKPLFEL